MESLEDSENSLPFIDNTTDEETSADQYNVKIIEKYQNKNRNIEITNQALDEVTIKSPSPVAPLAEEAKLSDSPPSPPEVTCRQARRVVYQPMSMKLVIKGWSSTVSIQGLDNKSSITFRRKNWKTEQDKRMGTRQREEKPNEDFFKPPGSLTPPEKPKKGKWKMLTRSLISKSAKFERRALDERYPKYVLLKNEEQPTKEEEIYPKMFVLNDKKPASKKPSENFQTNFKKSFNNKTKPMVSMEEILSTTDPKAKRGTAQKRLQTKRSFSEGRNLTFKKIVERRKSFVAGKATSSGNEPEMAFNVAGSSSSGGQVFNEIQGIFEDALKFCPDPNPGLPPRAPEESFQDVYASVPPQFCQFPCHESCCHPSTQPPMYIPVYSPYSKPTHAYRHLNTQTNEEETSAAEETLNSKLKQEDKELELQNLSFGILSSFFPRVVIMKTYQTENVEEEKRINEIVSEERKSHFEPLPSEEVKPNEDRLEDNLQTPKTLEIPRRDLSLKSKMVPENAKFEPEVASFFPSDLYINCLTLNEISSSDEERKTKTDDSEATEYLQFSENDAPGNESIKPTSGWESQGETTTRVVVGPRAEEKVEGDEGTIKNLSLTKIGYKMYDNLTKLSLKREKEAVDTAEAAGGCGCHGNGTRKSPCNITLQSNNRIVKVTVPDDQFNFRIRNPGGEDIQIGVTSAEAEREADDRKFVKKAELWHPDNDRKNLAVARVQDKEDDSKGCQTIQLSLAEKKGIILSIQMNERDKDEGKARGKTTKEVKVGTDDFQLVGGDFSTSSGGNCKNLSPRTGQLLKNLQHKLEFGKKERKFLEEKINEKLTDRKFKAGVLPGVFLVKQISPQPALPRKPFEGPSFKKPAQERKPDPVAPLREYYCEECLATMRIFEDENPSVKTMVDKFETIIQLESY